jgi:hypothetical protein
VSECAVAKHHSLADDSLTGKWLCVYVCILICIYHTLLYHRVIVAIVVWHNKVNNLTIIGNDSAANNLTIIGNDSAANNLTIIGCKQFDNYWQWLSCKQFDNYSQFVCTSFENKKMVTNCFENLNHDFLDLTIWSFTGQDIWQISTKLAKMSGAGVLWYVYFF